MKKHKSMFILLGIFLLLIVVYFVMSQANKRQDEKENGEKVMVTNLSNVALLEYTDGDDTMSFVKEEDIWYAADNKERKLDSELVQEMVDELRNVVAVRKLEGADEPEAYGLDDPLYTITMEDAEGEVVTLYIGDGAEGDYYATVNDKEVIYTISSSVAYALEFDITIFEVEEEVEEETTE